MFYYFHRGETVATTKRFVRPEKRILYPLSVRSVSEKWFKRFRNDDHDVNDKSRSKRATNWKHCSAQTIKKLVVWN